MSNLCNNCYYFQRVLATENGEVVGEYPYGHCICLKFKSDYSTYSVGEWMLYPDMVQVENDEGWGMRVVPAFGCIHHKSKEPL